MALQRLIVNSLLYSAFTAGPRETPSLHDQVGIIPPRRSGYERAPGGRRGRPVTLPSADEPVTTTVSDKATYRRAPTDAWYRRSPSAREAEARFHTALRRLAAYGLLLQTAPLTLSPTQKRRLSAKAANTRSRNAALTTISTIRSRPSSRYQRGDAVASRPWRRWSQAGRAHGFDRDEGSTGAPCRCGAPWP